jgi:hypothetical protein
MTLQLFCDAATSLALPHVFTHRKYQTAPYPLFLSSLLLFPRQHPSHIVAIACLSSTLRMKNAGASSVAGAHGVAPSSAPPLDLGLVFCHGHSHCSPVSVGRGGGIVLATRAPPRCVFTGLLPGVPTRQQPHLRQPRRTVGEAAPARWCGSRCTQLGVRASTPAGPSPNAPIGAVAVRALGCGTTTT